MAGKTAGGLGMKVRFKRDIGVVVWTVEVDRVAWTAGLRVGDVLHSVDGQFLDSIDHLLDCLLEVEVGGVINMEVRGHDSKPKPKPKPMPKPMPEPKPKPNPNPNPNQVRGHGASMQGLAPPPRYTYEPWPARASRPSGGMYLLRYIERAESDACAAEEESPPA